MLSALLRVVEAEGEIRLDGVPITRLGLATLKVQVRQHERVHGTLAE